MDVSVSGVGVWHECVWCHIFELQHGKYLFYVEMLRLAIGVNIA